MMELGIYTFGDIVPDPKTGRAVSGQERMRQMLDMAKLRTTRSSHFLLAAWLQPRREPFDELIPARHTALTRRKIGAKARPGVS